MFLFKSLKLWNHTLEVILYLFSHLCIIVLFIKVLKQKKELFFYYFLKMCQKKKGFPCDFLSFYPLSHHFKVIQLVYQTQDMLYNKPPYLLKSKRNKLGLHRVDQELLHSYQINHLLMLKE